MPPLPHTLHLQTSKHLPTEVLCFCKKKKKKVLTWLLWVSAHAQTHNIPRWGYCLVEIAVCKEGSFWGAHNTGPAWWDVVLRCWAPAVDHGPCDWSVQIPSAGGWGLVQPMEEQLVWRGVVQLVFVLLLVVVLAVVTVGELCVCLLFCLLLILFLFISVHAEVYGAVGVCWGERMRLASDVLAGKCSKKKWCSLINVVKRLWRMLHQLIWLPGVFGFAVKTVAQLSLCWCRRWVIIGHFSGGWGCPSNWWSWTAFYSALCVKTYMKRATDWGNGWRHDGYLQPRHISHSPLDINVNPLLVSENTLFHYQKMYKGEQ